MSCKLKKIVFIGTTAESTINFRGGVIKYLASLGHKIYVFCNDYTDKTQNIIISFGATPVSNPLNRSGINPFRDIYSLFILSRKLRLISADISFCYFVKPVIFGTLAAKFAGISKRVAMLEGLGYAFTNCREKKTIKRYIIRLIQIFLYRIILPMSHKLILLNDDDSNELKNNISSIKPLIFGGIGVPDNFMIYSKPNINTITFIFIGRLLIDKGVREFIEAASMVKSSFPKIKFKILGSQDLGNPESLSEKEFLQIKEKNIIELVGWVDNTEKVLRESSVFVLPSYREGFPRTIQEAMAIGRPVIAADVPGSRQAVSDGKTGYLVAPFSVEQIKNKMIYFIQNQKSIVDMGYTAHLYAKKQFCGKKKDIELSSIILN